MTAKDYYKVLGLSKDATTSQIEQAFNAIKIEINNKDVVTVEDYEAFLLPVEAYLVLGNAREKNTYDALETKHESSVPVHLEFWGRDAKKKVYQFLKRCYHCGGKAKSAADYGASLYKVKQSEDIGWAHRITWNTKFVSIPICEICYQKVLTVRKFLNAYTIFYTVLAIGAGVFFTYKMGWSKSTTDLILSTVFAFVLFYLLSPETYTFFLLFGILHYVFSVESIPAFLLSILIVFVHSKTKDFIAVSYLGDEGFKKSMEYGNIPELKTRDWKAGTAPKSVYET